VTGTILIKAVLNNNKAIVMNKNPQIIDKNNKQNNKMIKNHIKNKILIKIKIVKNIKINKPDKNQNFYQIIN
jgi:hypothetical protein